MESLQLGVTLRLILRRLLWLLFMSCPVSFGMDLNVPRKMCILLQRSCPVMVCVLYQSLLRCSGQVKNPSLWLGAISSLISVSIEVVDVVLGVMGANLSENESAPSFEQMGVAIQQVLTDQHQVTPPAESLSVPSNCGSGEGTTLSPEHQMVMTWCWTNIRESSISLSGLVKWLTSEELGLAVLGVNQVEMIADTFVKILTKCRHRGAIEGCNVGFLQLCSALLSSSEKTLFDIPRTILQSVLAKLQQLSKTSVTRRSAGLPLIVQSIVASEAKIRQTSLLSEAVTSLLRILESELPDHHNQQEDLPHIHALNILKAIFKESSVSQAIIPYISTATMRAIDLLSSPFWAVRNSAMQLYGILQARLIGQKKTADDTLHTTTAAEFFTLFPELHPYMTKKIEIAASSISAGTLQLHPSLFPVLSLLSKLSPDSTSFSGLSAFRDPITLLSASPLHAVRVLSAKAVVALVSKSDTLSFTMSLCQNLPNTKQDCSNYNRLHGEILQIQEMVNVHRHLTDELSLLNMLWSKHWIVDSENSCYPVKAAFICLLGCFVQNKVQKQDIIEPLMRMASDHIVVIATKENNRPGYAEFLHQLAKMRLSEETQNVADIVKICLESYVEDVRLACLTFLQDNSPKLCNRMDIENKTMIHLIQKELVCHLLRRPNWQELCGTLLLILNLSLQCGSFDFGDKKDMLWKELMNLLKTNVMSLPSSYALPVSATLLRDCFASNSDEWSLKKILMIDEKADSRIEEWAELLTSHAEPEKSEDARECSAKALCIVGKSLLDWCAENMSERKRVAQGILSCTMTLLNDEFSHIRNTAAVLVCELSPIIKGRSLQHNTALHYLGAYMSSQSREPLYMAQWIYQVICQGSLCLQDHLRAIRYKSSSTDEPFEASDVNPYDEHCVRNACLLKCAKDLDLHNSNQTEVWLNGNVNNIEEGIRSLMAVFEEEDLGFVVTKNPMFDRAVYLGLHSLLCQIQMLYYWCQTDLNLIRRLEACHEGLIKIPILHPSLAEDQRFILPH